MKNVGLGSSSKEPSTIPKEGRSVLPQETAQHPTIPQRGAVEGAEKGPGALQSLPSPILTGGWSCSCSSCFINSELLVGASR